MRQFKDNFGGAGRTWTVEINVATLKRVRGLTGTDLMQVIEGTLIEKLIRDPILLCDIVYAICKPEADAATPRITDEEFGKAMAGDAIEASLGVALSLSTMAAAGLGNAFSDVVRVWCKDRRHLKGPQGD